MGGEGNALTGLVDILLLTIILLIAGFFYNRFMDTRAGKGVDSVAVRVYRRFRKLPSWLQTTIQFAWGIGLSVLALWIYASI